MNSPTPDAKSVFGRAAEIPSPTERAAFLDQACANYPAVRAEVDALLKALGAAGSFMGSPAAPADRTSDYESPISEGEGTVVGPYTLRELIGEGGMGLVFVAEQSQPVRRKVALKVIKPGMDTRQVVARFEAERQALALMEHPHIAKVLDAGTTSAGRPYFVMELVRGVPITEYADANNLTPKDRLALFVQVCQAVQHAHQKGVIHRDLKPSNILVAPHDGIPVVKVIDFGVAKAVGQSLTEKTIYTRFAQMIGTPLYMSPEQAEVNQLDVDTRSDVYSLGVLLYELLTGTTPFDSDRFRKAAFDEVRRIIREEEPPRPSTRLTSLGATLTAVSARRGTDPARLAGLVRGELDWIVMKCLEKDRTRRYDGAAALAKDVQRYLSGDAVEACPPTLGYRLRKAYRRNRSAVRVTAAFVGVLLVGVVAATALAVQATRAEREANDNAIRAAANEDIARRAEIEAVVERDRVANANAHLRLTHYAAEMNLLQAAYDAKDGRRVAQLLDAQPSDLRGPEWHYWDRKFRGYEPLLSVPCPPPFSPPSNHWAHTCAFSPDGTTAAVTVAEKTGGMLLQIWNLAPCSLAHEVRVPPASNQKPGVPEHELQFSKDGRKVLVTRFVTAQSNPLTTRDQSVSFYYWLVDWRAGGAPVSVGEKHTAFQDRLNFSDDLEYAIDPQVDVKQRSTPLTVRRLADNAEVGRVTVPGLARAWLGPDRQHLLVFAYTEHRRFQGLIRGVPRQKAAISYWALGSERPVWLEETREDERAVEHLKSDGVRFRRLVAEDRQWVLRTCDVASGKPLGTDQPIAPISEVHSGTYGDASPPWCLSPDGRRIAYPSRFGVGVCDLGLESFDIESRRTTSVRYTFESLDTPPRQFAFLADGRLVAGWTPFEFQSQDLRSAPAPDDANRVVVRAWTVPPFGAEIDRASSADAASRDGRLFAFNPKRRIGASAPVQRLCVLDADGNRVFATDAPDLSPNPRVGFSADNRYVVTAGTSLAESAREQRPFVAWDLQTSREVGRAVPSPGTFFLIAPHRDAAVTDLFSPDGTRMVLPVASADTSFALPGPRLSGARVIKFPSGEPLFEFKIPDDAEVRALAFDADGITGHPLGRIFVRAGTTIPIYRWDGTTGAFRDRSQRTLTETWKSSFRSLPERWIERGNRAVRVRMSRDSSREFGLWYYTVEVWDAARRGPTDRPLFTHETAGACALSPDGRRLFLTVPDNPVRRAVVVCTTTGRELLALPRPYGGSFDDDKFARWSPDGSRFWYGADGDGKPVGWDFRPREQK